MKLFIPKGTTLCLVQLQFKLPDPTITEPFEWNYKSSVRDWVANEYEPYRLNEKEYWQFRLPRSPAEYHNYIVVAKVDCTEI